MALDRLFELNSELRSADVLSHVGREDKELISSLKPRYFEFEQARIFSNASVKLHSSKSKWWSMMKSIKLKTLAEINFKKKYRVVISLRFDTLFFSTFELKELAPHTLYAAKWNNYDAISDGLLQDYWFYGESKVIDELSNISNSIEAYIGTKFASDNDISNHIFCMKCVQESNVINDVRYTLREYKDFCLYRHYKNPINILRERQSFLFSKQSLLYFLALLHLEYPLKSIYAKFFIIYGLLKKNF